MAYPTEKPKQLAGLILQAEASRLALTEAHDRFRHRLNLPARIKASISSSPSKWLGGGLAVGLATSFLLRPGKRMVKLRDTKVKKQRGFLFGMLALLVTLFKPAVKIYATKLLKDYLSRRFTAGAQARPVAPRTSPY